MSISDRLDEIQARADKATDGPWDTLKDTWKGGTPVHRIGSDPTGDDVALTYRYEEAPEDRQGARDAEFIAHARNDVPAMLAAVRAVLDVCEGLEEAHRANPTQMYEYGMEEAAHQVRNAIAAAFGEES